MNINERLPGMSAFDLHMAIDIVARVIHVFLLPLVGSHFALSSPSAPHALHQQACVGGAGILLPKLDCALLPMGLAFF